MSHFHAALESWWFCSHQHRIEETARECADREAPYSSPWMTVSPRCDCTRAACRAASWEEYWAGLGREIEGLPR